MKALLTSRHPFLDQSRAICQVLAGRTPATLCGAHEGRRAWPCRKPPPPSSPRIPSRAPSLEARARGCTRSAIAYRRSARLRLGYAIDRPRRAGGAVGLRRSRWCSGSVAGPNVWLIGAHRKLQMTLRQLSTTPPRFRHEFRVAWHGYNVTRQPSARRPRNCSSALSRAHHPSRRDRDERPDDT